MKKLFLLFTCAAFGLLPASRIDSKLIEQLALVPSNNVLEIGCAGGDDANELATYLSDGTVVAIDGSPFQIDTAKKTYDQKNLLFRTLDPLDIDYADYFNAVVSFSALHWVDNHGELLERVHTALRPSGKLFFEMPNGLPQSLLTALQQTLEQENWEQYRENFKEDLAYYSTAEYREMLKKTGFIPQEITSLEKTVTFSSKSDFIRFLIGWLPHLQSLPLGKRMHFLNQVLAHYFNEQPLDERGEIHIPITTLSVYALKHD